MINSFLYSIGHSNKSLDELIFELRLYKIQYLVDVRSTPYSKFYPHFNREQLQTAINNTGDIVYGYMGDVIGGLPKNPDCYTNGKVDYGKIRHMPFFIKGIDRLVKANENGFYTCLMCSEGDPKMCHRSKLIGEALRDRGVMLHHICKGHKGNIFLKSQIDVIQEANNGNSLLDLFGETQNLTSRNTYKL
jgi:uncharacterized protein (DUF488 family)